MSFEMYTIELDGDQKVMSYDGYFWIGEEEIRDDGAECHWRFDYCNKWCAVPVSENGADGLGLFDLLMLEYEKYPQYSDPVTDDEHAEDVAYMKEHRTELDADDVTEDTPCGMYWFETRE